MEDGDTLPVRPDQVERFEKELLDMPLPEEDSPLVASLEPAVGEAEVRAYFEATEATEATEAAGREGPRRRDVEEVLLDYFR